MMARDPLRVAPVVVPVKTRHVRVQEDLRRLVEGEASSADLGLEQTLDRLDDDAHRRHLRECQPGFEEAEQRGVVLTWRLVATRLQ